MSDSPNPWARPTPPAPEPRPRTHRLLLWVALVLAGAVGILELTRLFPNSVSDQDMPWLARSIALLALVSAGVIFGRQIKFAEAARNVAIWVVILAVLVIGYALRDDLSGLGTRIQSEFLPSDPVASGDHSMTLVQDDNGDYHVYGTADGIRIRFLVDTGATDIVLAPSDARRLGVNTASLHFLRGTETANGEGASAPYQLDRLNIGPVQLWNVSVSINRAEMHTSLLGMAFLKRMKSFEFRGNELIIRW